MIVPFWFLLVEDDLILLCHTFLIDPCQRMLRSSLQQVNFVFLFITFQVYENVLEGKVMDHDL